MIDVRTRAALRREIGVARNDGRRISLVPTMGYLHEGHLSLIDIARSRSDLVVLSVFVNPLQFGPGEDLERYPRDLPRDAALAAARGVDVFFAPEAAGMYPDGDSAVTVNAQALAQRLCGAFRPGHFEGVLTVVAKLFNIVQPDVAVFGRKDFQQLTLVRRMARDLDFDIDIVGGPIIREADGLALSSRNIYLDAAGRADAILLSRALADADASFSNGERRADTLIRIARARLAQGTSVTVQYVELVDTERLEPVAHAAAGDVLAIAALVGRTRLIDNHVFGDVPE